MKITMTNIALVTLAAAMIALPSSLWASGNPESGQEKAKVCEACHGLDGKSVDPNYPNLAGQHESYLIKALSDYRAGRRSNAIMGSFAANLSNQDIEDLAAWYSMQDGLKDLSIK